MKRLLLVLALAVLPTSLFADAIDRDVLVTPDGTLFTVESALNDGSAPANVKFLLRLNIQPTNGQAQTLNVPDSLTAGTHTHPALAWDADSQTLFVFWLKMPNPTSSELLLSSYHNSTWQPAVSVGNSTYHLVSNLQIRTMHRVADLPLLVHAVWWEDTGDSESARYGLFVIDKGSVTTIYLDDLSNLLYIDPNGNPTVQLPATFPVDGNFNREILRHPSLIDTGASDSIDVLFGDVKTNSFNRVSLKPIIQGRIHIPIGHMPGPRVVAPKSFISPWTGPIDTIVSGRDGSLLLYNTTKDAVNYLVYNGSWSSVKSIALSDKLSADAAVAALARMMNQ